MWIAKTVDQVRQLRSQTHGPVSVVPTMGALHKGHRYLIQCAKQNDSSVIVTLFVNPTQFAPGEDFERYPRPLDHDLDVCRQAGAAGVFCPSVSQIYPPGSLDTEITVPALTNQLEGRCRPGHFSGVCRVVAKIFGMVEPAAAFFGRKDYQQLKVIEAMVQDLAMPVQVVGVPTVREDDGLAVSSRNVYLEGDARRQAIGLYRALAEAKALVEDGGESEPAMVEAAMSRVLSAYRVDTDYAVVRHRKSLVALDCIEPQLTGPVVALVAGRVGGVRLIDAMVLGGP